jgi:hypothetical protein
MLLLIFKTFKSLGRQTTVRSPTNKRRWELMISTRFQSQTVKVLKGYGNFVPNSANASFVYELVAQREKLPYTSLL